MLLFVFVMLLFACEKEENEDDCLNYASTSIYVDPLKYSEYTPIEIPLEELGSLISFQEPFEIEKSGKIYIKDNLMIIGEGDLGFHFFDNSDPKNPIQKKFLKIEGTSDIAIRGDYVYLNQYKDLVTLKIDLNSYSFEETGREKEVFSNHIYYGKQSPDFYYFYPTEGSIITGFKKKKNFKKPEQPKFEHTNCYKEAVLANESSSNSDGQGGSLAKFTLKEDYLYTVDNRKLNTFLILGDHVKNPSFIGSIDVGFSIETLFNFKENLFIGSSSAMYIYNISTPENPVFVSEAQHFRACDPVIANDTHAFVTIHGGSRCGGNSNQLKVYDILDIKNPKLLLDKNLIEPKGIALYGDYILVADKAVRVFNVADVKNGNLPFVTKIDVNANDLIIRDNHLFIIGDFGIYQYELEDNTELKITNLSELIF